MPVLYRPPRSPRPGALLLLLELEGGGIDAVAQPRRPGAVRKHVAEMGVAVAAVRFRAGHPVAAVLFHGDIFLLRRLPEAGPAAAGLELVIGAEQLGAAAHAAVDAGLVIVPVLAGEGALRAVLARHLELLRRQLLLPLCI